jgi:acetyl esterase/lipase
MNLPMIWKWMGVVTIFGAMTHAAVEPVEVTLFPEGAVEPAGFVAEPEGLMEDKKKDGVKRVGNVSVPMMTVYRPETGANGTAVLVCPGGGYSILAIEHEGTQVCEWLNSLGVTAVLLKYRVPRRDATRPHVYPLEDARQAMKLLRARGGEWGIKPDRIGVLGFSAGGNLSVMLALNPEGAGDMEAVRPNFAVPVYPAYLTVGGGNGELVKEIVVDEKAPPVCLIHAHNDKITPAGSALLYLAYQRAGRPAELHVYSAGGHGFGMKANGDAINEWPARVGAWLKQIGMLEPAGG